MASIPELFWAVMTIVAFCLMCLDKSRAQNQSSRNRISEFWLLMPVLLCGPYGSLVGMFLVQHKVSARKRWFQFKLVTVSILYFFFLRHRIYPQ